MQHQEFLNVSDICRLPEVRASNGGRPIHLSTAIRWITVGADGVRLKAIRPTRSWLVRRDDLDKFFQERADAACARSTRDKSMASPAVNSTQTSHLRAKQRVRALAG